MNHIFACCKASVWKDLLTAFDNGTITYDASGNPTSYYNGTRWTMSWENGRQLVSATTDISDTEEMVVEYVYDMNGLRVSKTVTVNTYEAHTHSYTTTVVEPNCTARGYTRYTCACGDSYIDNYVAALGHIYDSLSDKECNRCGYNRNTGGIIITPPDPDYPIIGTGISDVETTSETASDRVLLSTNSEQHDYIYASGKLLREVITTGEGATATTQTLDFFYDANGTPLALKTNNTVYYYVTNLQGDVIQLIDSTGTAVAAYEYDPYGNIVFQSGNLADLNPLRYRGYYYDAETGFYYLQSRYYDPKIGRFINADGYASTGQGVIGYNMFAYCRNNPIVNADKYGNFPWLVLGIAVVAVIIGAVVGYNIDEDLGPTEEQSSREYPQMKTRLPKPLLQRPTYLEDPWPGNVQNVPPDFPEAFSSDESSAQVENCSTVNRWRNAAIGGLLGLVAAGGIIATGGAAGTVLLGSATTTIAVFGLTGAQTFAIGGVIYDVGAMIISSFFGVEMETIEYEP